MSVAGGTEESVPVKADGAITIGTDGMTENRITTEVFLPPFTYI